jgi:virginiamycin B lyase
MGCKALYRRLRDRLFCGLFIVMLGFSPLWAQITEYPVPFNGLSGIAAGPDGAMWFTGNRNIGRITTAGVVTSYPLPTSNAGSAGITAGPDGAMWFTEYSGVTLAKIGRITTSGVFTEYALPDPTSIPSAITAGPDGALWFIESGNTNIGRITTSGTITEFPLPASEKNTGVYALTAGPDGNLWFSVDYGANKIIRMTTSGVFTIYTVTTFANGGSLGIAAGPDGALWFADQAGKIGRITTSGTVTEYTLPQASDAAFGIAAGPDGALWFTDSFGQIGRITTSGAVTSQVATPTNTANGFLGSIAPGPDGAMWFAEAGKIGRIPTGVTVTPPTITEVANAEGEAPTISPNTWVLIKGSNLAKAGDSRIWQDSDFVNGQMPTQPDGVSVTVNGKPAYVYYLSPTQLNILTPPDAISGSVQIQVTNNGAISATFTAQAQAESPSFFVFNGGPYITAVHLNGGLIGPATLYPGYSTPAQPSETIVIFANGFGTTSTPIVLGSSIQSGLLSPLPVIKIGGLPAQVTFAGLVAPGEFQFNVVVPSSLSNGDQPVTATYNGSATQAGTLLTVHQ